MKTLNLDLDLAKINPQLDQWMIHCARNCYYDTVAEMVSFLRESKGKIENNDRAIKILNKASSYLSRAESLYFRKGVSHQADYVWPKIIKTEIDKAISEAKTSS